MEALFTSPSEFGSNEWSTFRIVRNDLRPVSKWFLDSIRRDAARAGERIDDSRTPTPRTLTPEQRLADIQEAYNC